jgi:anti-sigma factor RsiW
MSERETMPAGIHPEGALLPWYANGTLKAEERQHVARHLEACPDCRRELDELSQMKSALTAVYRAEPEPSAQLARSVLNRVAQDAAGRGVAVKGRGHWLDGLDEWFRSLFQPQWVPTLAALALAVQFGLLLWVTTPSGPSEQITTRSVGGSTAAFNVIFEDQATAGQIHVLLDSIGAKVIDGPDAGHAYLIRVSAADPAVTAKTLDTLRARTDMVLRADPVSP